MDRRQVGNRLGSFRGLLWGQHVLKQCEDFSSARDNVRCSRSSFNNTLFPMAMGARQWIVNLNVAGTLWCGGVGSFAVAADLSPVF